MSWEVVYSSNARVDLIGLEPNANEEISSAIDGWAEDGPPRTNARLVSGSQFFETVIANQYLLGYHVTD